MKTITFNYTKKDGSTSERTLLVMVSPGGDKYAGIDVSSIDPDEAAEFTAIVEELHADYLDKLQYLQATYDLKHNYRQFLVSGMTDITEI
jgi:hypothetical protein